MTKKIIVTYNFPPVNHWRQILSSFVGDLLMSGLYDKAAEIIFFAKKNPIVTRHLEALSSLKKISPICVPDSESVSMSQLRFISERARSGLANEVYLCASARGVSYNIFKDPKKSLSVWYWAKMLNYFSLFDHERALAALDTHDAAGTNWVPANNIHAVPAHFQGNGWWATSQYLARLPPVPPDAELRRQLASNPLYAQKPGKNPGWGLWGEFWIGFASPRVFEQFSAYDKMNNGLGWHYSNIIPESAYDSSYIQEPISI